VDSRLYLITGARPDLESFLEAAVRGGVDIVQIREKKLADGELLAALQQARELTRRLGVPLVVNDRPGHLHLLANGLRTWGGRSPVAARNWAARR
jgi:thiamine-phosphate pyrophosphorylase